MYCCSFVFAALEDFGIAPLEAQSCGTPVIAYGKGGALETISGLDEAAPSGVFYSEQNSASLAMAIAQFEDNISRIKPEHCRKKAEEFSEERFLSEFRLRLGVENQWKEEK